MDISVQIVALLLMGPEGSTIGWTLTSSADSYQVGRGDVGVLTEGVEEDSDGEGEVARLELPAGPNFRREALHGGHWLKTAVQHRLLKIT